jgi:four helix bundle suffix protein
MAGLIESAKRRFLEEGGIREEMTRARLKYRNGRK